MELTFCSLQEKEVINLCDGQRLGCVCDLSLDGCGRVLAIYVALPGKLFCFGKEKKLCIPWDRVEKIGEDTLLVTYPVNAEKPK